MCYKLRVPFLGVISDTHDLLRPEVLPALHGCDLIVHAGDICGPEVLARLGELAPVRAVRGNNDRGAWCRDLPERDAFEFEGRRVLVVHDRAELTDSVLAEADLVISGHSHLPRFEEHLGRLDLNPGSAGPRRFRLPIAVARVEIDTSGITCELVHLIP